MDSAEVKTGDAVARPADLSPTVPACRRVIGVALEGGGALGLAHVGVLKWVEANRVPIDHLAGTSMGALIGALYASGMTAAELERVATRTDFAKSFTCDLLTRSCPIADAKMSTTFRRSSILG